MNWNLLNLARNRGLCSMPGYQPARVDPRVYQPVSAHAVYPIAARYLGDGLQPGRAAKPVPFAPCPFDCSWWEWEEDERPGADDFGWKIEQRDGVRGLLMSCFAMVTRLSFELTTPDVVMKILSGLGAREVEPGVCEWFAGSRFVYFVQYGFVETAYVRHLPYVPVMGAQLLCCDKTLHPEQAGALDMVSPMLSGRPESEIEEFSKLVRDMGKVLLLYFAFASCRNASLVEVHPAARRPKAVTNPARVIYRKLTIDPLRRVVSNLSERPPRPDERGTAIHLVRGHFKEYGERGLFGRYHGRWWWGPHTAGDDNFGTVVKSYEIGDQ